MFGGSGIDAKFCSPLFVKTACVPKVGHSTDGITGRAELRTELTDGARRGVACVELRENRLTDDVLPDRIFDLNARSHKSLTF
jgi:hypothetical protein